MYGGLCRLSVIEGYCLLKLMKKAEKLLEKYRAGNCTTEELQLLLNWFHEIEEEDRYELTETDLLIAKAALRKNIAELTKPRITIVLWPRILSAAVLFIAIAFGVYFYSLTDAPKTTD